MKKIILILILQFYGLFYAQNIDQKIAIDSLLTTFQQNNAFSGEVLIQQDGRTIYKGAFNSFDVNSDKFRIGSITKIFTATIIFQLIEEGKLSLETNLSAYYPEIKHANDITIGNLLNHSSGIYNYLEWEDYYASKQQMFTKQQMLDLIKKGKTDFKPGKDVSYSNSAYLLLGYIIEDITKQTFEENLNSRIINKLGLKNTYYEKDISEYSKRNSSYFFDGEKWFKETETHPSFTLTAGAMVSNTEDLSRFMTALFNKQLVSVESLKKMGAINQGGFGFGFQYAPFYELHGFGHSGHLDEFRAFTAFFPQERLSFTILSNGNRFNLNEVTLAVVSKLYNKPFKIPDFSVYKSKNLDSSKKFTGVYKAKLIGLISLGTFNITEAANDHLYLSMDDEPGRKVLMERKAENKYLARANNAEFEFEMNKHGKVTGVKINQKKMSVNCKKVK